MTNIISIAGDQYADSSIIEANAFLVQSMAGNELEYDTLDATLDLSSYLPVALAPTDADVLADSATQVISVYPWVRVLVHDASAYTYGAVILAYHNNVLLGKFYMTSITRVGKYTWSIEAISPIGVLDKSKHYGGIYATASDTFSAVLADIIGGAVPYTLNPALANILVRGWLPVATRRENLHQLLFAMGACVKKADNGDIYVTYLDPLSSASVSGVPNSRIYTGGTVEYPDKATEIILHEHAYVQSALDVTETLFEGQVTAESMTTPTGVTRTGALVLFSEPCYDLAASGVSILESGANYAVISGGSAVLTGKKYTHTVRQVTMGEASTDDNIISFEDATLVNVLNSESVVERLYSYYHSSNQVSMDIVVDDERAGDGVSFADPFDDAAEGYIAELGINMSGILKGVTKIVTDYEPTTGNKYNNCDILVADGTWTVPQDVEEIRVVLVGAGSSGEIGGYGNGGTSGTETGYGEGGAGGVGGLGGEGGKIRTIDLEVTAGDVITFSRGSSNVTITHNGTTYSSGSGRRSASGYTDLVHGHTFGLPGSAGVAGGAGDPNGGNVVYNGVTYTPGEQGSSGTWED